MVDKVAELEAALASQRTPELLAVYADALQALGDPRGELIAIDLQVAAQGTSPELAAHKRQRVEHWLGAELATRVLEIGAVDCGFVDIPWGVKADEAERMLAHAGLHAALRTFALEDADAGLRRGIDLVCAARPPWLEHVQVVRYSPDEADIDVPAIDDARARALVDAIPRLRAFTLAGNKVFGELVHPNVRELCLYDYDAVGSLLSDGPAWASLREVDLQFSAEPGEDVLATMLAPARVPALRRLDLARNEALWRDQAFALVGANPVVRQLEWLQVPSVRTDAHLDALERAALADGAEVIVARAFEGWQPTRAASPRLRVPPARPWPPWDASPSRLTVKIPGQRDGTDIVPREAIALMEGRFDALAEPERTTWTELWRGVRALTASSSFEVSAPALEVAIAALQLGDAHPTWAALRDALAGSTAEMVQIRRWSLFG
ncbi:MAG: hypothetical protein ABI678_10730 [Kofleriaceae bacterium]